MEGWNKVPKDLKDLSKTMLEHLRPSDQTKNYDFFYPKMGRSFCFCVFEKF
jgi:hypothetical protein